MIYDYLTYNNILYSSIFIIISYGLYKLSSIFSKKKEVIKRRKIEIKNYQVENDKLISLFEKSLQLYFICLIVKLKNL